MAVQNQNPLRKAEDEEKEEAKDPEPVRHQVLGDPHNPLGNRKEKDKVGHLQSASVVGKRDT